jgi:hypothetical protein
MNLDSLAHSALLRRLAARILAQFHPAPYAEHFGGDR